MLRSSAFPLLVGGLCAAIVSSPATAAAQPAASPSTQPAETEAYTVVAGDSCLSIAKRVLGSAKALRELHRLNPQLGRTPHALKAGQKLIVPRRAPAVPDANLTAARGDVAVRRPSESIWDAAQRGMDLFRAWRVGARAKASAEVTFRDHTQLHLRENTVVVIYGPAAPRQPVTALRAELEGGSLEARLASATGPAPEILTPSSLTRLGRGDVLFSVDPAGTSLIANHEGEPAEVRAVTKKRPRGAPVRVAKGMGSRVEQGKLPEPPRPLPLPPTFAQPSVVVATFAAASTVPIAWQPVAGAIQYRVVVVDAQGAEQNVVTIPPGEASLELADVPAGAIRVLVSAIDSAGFEGAPASLDVRVVAVAIAPPGADRADQADGPDGAGRADAPAVEPPPGVPGAAPATRKIALGSSVVGPAGFTCALHAATEGSPRASAPGEEPVDAIARRLGRHRVQCRDAASASDTASVEAVVEAEVEVVAVTGTIVGPPAPVTRDRATELTIALTSDGSSGPILGQGIVARPSPGLVIESQRQDGATLVVTVHATAQATAAESLQLAAGEIALATVAVTVATPIPPSVAAARWTLDLGGFVGLALPPHRAELGAPQATRDQLTNGPQLGARLTLRRPTRPWLAGRVELVATTLSQRGTPKIATWLSTSASLALRPLVLGDVELWAYAGAGAARLASAPGTLRTQNALSLDAGVSLVVRKAGLACELGPAWSLLEPGGLRELWPSLRLGLAATFGR